MTLEDFKQLAEQLKRSPEQGAPSIAYGAERLALHHREVVGWNSSLEAIVRLAEHKFSE